MFHITFHRLFLNYETKSFYFYEHRLIQVVLPMMEETAVGSSN